MRYLIFAPEQHYPLIEGIQKSAFSTIKELRRQGHVVDIVSQYSYGTLFNETSSNIIISSHKNRLIKYCMWVRDAILIRLSLKKNKYDQVWVFSMDWSFLLPLLFIKYSFLLPFRVLVFSARECKGVSGWALSRIKNGNVRFWCGAERIQELLMSRGVIKEQIIQKPIFFTLDFLNKQSEIKKEKGSIAYLSSSDTNAGIDIIISLAKKFPDKKFTLAVRKFSRDTSAQKKLEAVKKLKLRNLNIERNIPNMENFLAKMEIVILPPKNEDNTMAVPLVALEASYLDCLVIMTDLPVFKGLFENRLANRFNAITDIEHLLQQPIQKNTDIDYISTIPDLIQKFIV